MATFHSTTLPGSTCYQGESGQHVHASFPTNADPNQPYHGISKMQPVPMLQQQGHQGSGEKKNLIKISLQKSMKAEVNLFM